MSHAIEKARSHAMTELEELTAKRSLSGNDVEALRDLVQIIKDTCKIECMECEGEYSYSAQPNRVATARPRNSRGEFMSGSSREAMVEALEDLLEGCGNEKLRSALRDCIRAAERI